MVNKQNLKTLIRICDYCIRQADLTFFRRDRASGKRSILRAMEFDQIINGKKYIVRNSDIVAFYPRFGENEAMLPDRTYGCADVLMITWKGNFFILVIDLSQEYLPKIHPISKNDAKLFYENVPREYHLISYIQAFGTPPEEA